MGFAKLFETDDCGQLVAIRDTNDDGKPAVTVFAEPEELGVCSNALVFNDTDEGWDAQEKYFKELTEEQAKTIISPIFDVAKRLAE